MLLSPYLPHRCCDPTCTALRVGTPHAEPHLPHTYRYHTPHRRAFAPSNATLPTFRRYHSSCYTLLLPTDGTDKPLPLPGCWRCATLHALPGFVFPHYAVITLFSCGVWVVPHTGPPRAPACNIPLSARCTMQLTACGFVCLHYPGLHPFRRFGSMPPHFKNAHAVPRCVRLTPRAYHAAPPTLPLRAAPPRAACLPPAATTACYLHITLRLYAPSLQLDIALRDFIAFQLLYLHLRPVLVPSAFCLGSLPGPSRVARCRTPSATLHLYHAFTALRCHGFALRCVPGLPSTFAFGRCRQLDDMLTYAFAVCAAHTHYSLPLHTLPPLHLSLPTHSLVPF